jgi:hypothetical protein
MAYNVFKRPMFKRGGSTTGTGIMSHVEPRVNAANGFPTFGLSRQPDQSEIDAFRQAEAQRIQNIRNQPGMFSQLLGPRFTDPNYQSPFQNFFSTNTGFGFMDPGIPSREAGIMANVQPITAIGTDTGMSVDTGTFETEKQNIEANEAAIAAAEKAALEKKTGNGTIDTGTKDDSTYKVSDLETTVKEEADFLRKLLKDENYSKGELALIIAGAVKEPGGISEKLDKARELSLPIARKRREEDKAITLAAYKAAKEKEKYQTRYGQDTDYIRNLKSQAKSLVGRPGYENKSEDQIFQDLIASKTSDAQGREEILTKGGEKIFDLRSKIIRKTKELADPKTNERTKKALQQELEKHKSELQFFTNLPEFEKFYGTTFKSEVGLKNGGRVMKAVGGEASDEDTDMETSDNTVGMAVDKIGEGSGSQTVTEGVQRLSYNELRDRLPQEITDDVVNLLANSEEALQQFAYIRTQDDVNSFNAKYGVNLVIPPTRG